MTRARRTLQAMFPDLVGAWVFGSLASNRIHARSDIDLAIWCGRPVEPVRRFEAQRDLGVALDRDVDLVDLATASTLVGKEVFLHGIVLVQNDPGAILDLQARTYSDYASLMDATRGIREAIQRDGVAFAR